MRGLAADLHYAGRIYLTTPLASAIAIVVLAISMAVVAAFLSLYSDLVLESNGGFERASRLVTVGQNDGQRFSRLNLAFIETANEELGGVESLAGSLPVQQFVERDDGTEPIATELVTREYFPGARPHLELGRGFAESDHEAGAAPVVILSHAYWREHFDADPGVLGTSIRIAGPTFVMRTSEGEANASEQTQAYRIVGVMAPSVRGTFDASTEVWMPYEQVADAFFGAVVAARSMQMLLGVGRLADQGSVASLTAELRGRFGEPNQELGLGPSAQLDVIGALTLNPERYRDVQRQLELFLAGSILLAFVAACNVSLFLLSRAPGRRRELGIRMAVGAPLKRLARQLASEAGLLVVVATLAGLAVSLWLVVLVQDLPFLEGSFWRDASPLDWRVLALVIGLSALLTLLVSLAPISGLRRLGIAASSRSGSASAGLGQRLAGSAQITIAGVLAGTALAFGWYLAILVNADRGFDARGVYAVRVQAQGPGIDFDPNAENIVVERERRRELIEALPGVTHVAFGTAVPGRDDQRFRASIPRPDATSPDIANTVSVPIDSAGPSFLEVLNMRLVDGRALEVGDREEVLINETLARELWGRTDVAGETIAFGPDGGWPVVGVVFDAAYGHPAEEIGPRLIRTYTPASAGEQILIRGELTAAVIREGLQRLVESGELGFEITSIDRVEDLLAAGLAADRARLLLTAAAAGLVVVLAAFGFYGLQRYLVSSGRREFAIRAALGAGPKALGRLVVVRGVALAAPGLVLGSLLAFVVVAWLRGDFVASAVSPYVVTALVAAGLAVLVLAASLGPARAARRMRAGLVLREE